MYTHKTSANCTGLCFFFAILAMTGCSEKAPAAKPPAPTPTVVVSKAIAMDVPIERFENGVTLAPEKVEVRARVRGFIASRNFKEGEDVKKDQLLFVIEEGPFKAAVEIAQAAVSDAEVNLELAVKGVKAQTAKSQLERDEAALEQARLEVNRYTELVKGNAAPQQQLDQRVAREKELSANVSAAKATLSQVELTQKSDSQSGAARVAAAKAELALRQLDLSYCRITAPFDGRIGTSSVSIGALVGGPGDVPLATILQVDPLEVSFKLDGKLLPRIQKRMAEIKNLQVEISTGKDYIHPHRGLVTLIDNAVDPDTSTFTARATVPNTEKTILPGLFVKTRIFIGVNQGAILLPERAVTFGTRGSTVYVVADDKKVKAVTVQTGLAYGDLIVIESGVAPGDSVVVEGGQFIRPGMTVETTEAPIELPEYLKKDVKPATDAKPATEVKPAADASTAPKK